MKESSLFIYISNIIHSINLYTKYSPPNPTTFSQKKKVAQIKMKFPEHSINFGDDEFFGHIPPMLELYVLLNIPYSIITSYVQFVTEFGLETPHQVSKNYMEQKK